VVARRRGRGGHEFGLELRSEFGGHLEAAVTAPISFARLAPAFCLGLALSAIPVFSTVLPPILDYPNHLARMSILAADGGSAVLNQFYAVHWAPLPNLALDLIVPPLTALMPLALAGKLFLVLVLALMAGGAVALNRVLHGRWSYWSLGVFLLLYNRILLWGFLNYLFGLGLALCGLALWLGMARRPAWQRVVLSSVLALAVYFSHISAFGIYALALAGIEAGPALVLLRTGDGRRLAARLAIAGVQFIVPAAIILLSWRGAATGTIAYGNYGRKVDLLFSIFDNYNRGFDVACFALFAALLLALAAWRRLGLAPAMRGPLLLVTSAYLALPSQMLSGAGADHRMAIAIFLIILAGSAPRWPSPRVALATGAALLLLFAVRLGMVEVYWIQSDAVYQADLAALDSLPRGAKLAVAWPGSAIEVTRAPELHLPTLAIARREAFVPTLFAYAAQQPVALTPDYAALALATRETPLWTALIEERAKPPARVLAALKSYDFIVFINRTPFEVPQSACLSAMRPGTSFQLFAIHPDCADWQ
jgi:hypothetical protein